MDSNSYLWLGMMSSPNVSGHLPSLMAGLGYCDL
jgi:hypothetical protein